MDEPEGPRAANGNLPASGPHFAEGAAAWLATFSWMGKPAAGLN